MDRQEIIKKTELFVKKTVSEDSTGHDWWHVHRVRNLAKRIAREESADIFIVELAALLHDIGDYKFFQGDEEAGTVKVREWLSSLEISPSLIDKIVEITSQISFMHTLPDKGEGKGKKNSAIPILSKELMSVTDADRLDAMGAIGIARAFTYGGFFNRPIYDPVIKPSKYITKEKYKTTQAPSINHFYEKLLKLKDMMYTKLGRKMAKRRRRFLNLYLKQFFKEWKGKM
ncbi:HD domain-containing protein [bacterium]|nr:HD domain-containing protein [bacterium]MBU4362352.1 HD domain-containing protein [bacterium]MCG2762574.1 HD domain-containing protein [Candidatus Atribacteria bacterium]